MRQGSARVLVLGGAARSQGERCLQQALERGLRPVLADRPEHLEALPQVTALADEVVALDYADTDACLAWAASTPLRADLAGVCAFREYAVASAAAVAHALGLPGNPPEAVATVRDKHRCREALRRLGFAQPASALCDAPADARAFCHGHGPGPWVVKPAGAMGSLGVTRVTDGDAAAAAVAALRDAGHARVLVETWQRGVELSAEGVFERGRPRVLAFTRKHLVAGSFVELGHALPARPPVLERAREAVTGALTGLGLRFGVFHVELWVDGDDVVLGEVHARPGGDYLHWLVELVCGVQPYGWMYDQMLGRPTTLLPPAAPAAAVCFLVRPPGRVVAVGDMTGVTGDPACLRLDVDVEPGDEVASLRDSFDRCGFVVASGDDEAGAWRAARDLASAAGARIAVEEAGVP